MQSDITFQFNPGLSSSNLNSLSWLNRLHGQEGSLMTAARGYEPFFKTEAFRAFSNSATSTVHFSMKIYTYASELGFDLLCLKCLVLCSRLLRVFDRTQLSSTTRSLAISPHNDTPFITMTYGGTLHEPIYRAFTLTLNRHIMGHSMSPYTTRSLTLIPHIMGHSMSSPYRPPPPPPTHTHTHPTRIGHSMSPIPSTPLAWSTPCARTPRVPPH